MDLKQELINRLGVPENWDKYDYQTQRYSFDDMQEVLEDIVKKLTIPAVMPRISHFIDENGTAVDLNAEGVNVRLKRDGTHEYFRSFGFAGRKELTPVYCSY